MIELSLFYDEESKKYFWIGDDKCSKCKHPMIHVGYLLWDYWKAEFRQLVYCYSCKLEIKKAGGKYTELKKVFVVPKESMPLSSIGLFPQRPELADSYNMSVWELATKIVDQERVTDKTVACHDSQFMIQSDAKKTCELEFEEDGLALLEFHRKAEPADSDIKLIENKKGEPK